VFTLFVVPIFYTIYFFRNSSESEFCAVTLKRRRRATGPYCLGLASKGRTENDSEELRKKAIPNHKVVVQPGATRRGTEAGYITIPPGPSVRPTN
jgi:hypothetical protein